MRILICAGFAIGAILASSCGNTALPAVPFHHGLYASPTGRLDGEGTLVNPWDLATAVGRADRLDPGDTLWLLAGTYRGVFVSLLAGDSAHHVVVRQFPGMRATIDGGLVVRGSHSEFWDFEVTNSDTNRETDETGSSPSKYKRPGGADNHASDTKFVNLVVHDAGGGFGIFSDGSNVELYGCLIYNNGWEGHDRGHGHGIYGQNRVGVKRLQDNVIFHQFGHGMQLYGSDQAFLHGFQLEGNVSFENGALSSQPNGIDFFIGGGSPATEIVVSNNYSYRSDGLLTARFGYGNSVVNEDLALSGNYFAGQTQLLNWQSLTVTGNTFTGARNLVELRAPQGTGIRDYAFSSNSYLPDSRRTALNSDQLFVVTEHDTSRAFGIDGWRAMSGADTSERTTGTQPTGEQVFVRANKYEAGRANIVVFNWSHARTVQVDVSHVLRAGDRYQVKSVEDFFGRPVLAGVFNGHMLQLPMKAYRAAAPVGSTPSSPPRMGPEFGVFILMRQPG